MATAGMAGAWQRTAVSARGSRATRVLESAQRRAQRGERRVRRLRGRGEAGGRTAPGRLRWSPTPRAAAAHATRHDQRQCGGRGADRHRVAGDAVHLGRHSGQRVRLLGTDSIRLRSARHSPAAHEPRSGPRRGRGRPGRGGAPSRGRAAVLRASRSRRDARRDVCRGAQVHPQLEPRREAVAAGSAGPGGGVLAGPVGGGAEDHPVRGAALSREALPTTALRWSPQRITRQRLFCNASLGIAFVLSCAPSTRYEQPDALRGYEILVTSQDSLERGIAQGLARRGFRVRTRLRGGGRPTAYLFAFIFRETEPPALTWLHVRLADTRTGAIVAAVSAPLDSLGMSAGERARAIVDSLAANPALRRVIAPT